jgi:hypothetical protein
METSLALKGPKHVSLGQRPRDELQQCALVNNRNRESGVTTAQLMLSGFLRSVHGNRALFASSRFRINPPIN